MDKAAAGILAVAMLIKAGWTGEAARVFVREIMQEGV